MCLITNILCPCHHQQTGATLPCEDAIERSLDESIPWISGIECDVCDEPTDRLPYCCSECVGPSCVRRPGPSTISLPDAVAATSVHAGSREATNTDRVPIVGDNLDPTLAMVNPAPIEFQQPTFLDRTAVGGPEPTAVLAAPQCRTCFAPLDRFSNCPWCPSVPPTAKRPASGEPSRSKPTKAQRTVEPSHDPFGSAIIYSHSGPAFSNGHTGGEGLLFSAFDPSTLVPYRPEASRHADPAVPRRSSSDPHDAFVDPEEDFSARLPTHDPRPEARGPPPAFNSSAATTNAARVPPTHSLPLPKLRQWPWDKSETISGPDAPSSNNESAAGPARIPTQGLPLPGPEGRTPRPARGLIMTKARQWSIPRFEAPASQSLTVTAGPEPMHDTP